MFKIQAINVMIRESSFKSRQQPVVSKKIQTFSLFLKSLPAILHNIALLCTMLLLLLPSRRQRLAFVHNEAKSHKCTCYRTHG